MFQKEKGTKECAFLKTRQILCESSCEMIYSTAVIFMSISASGSKSVDVTP